MLDVILDIKINKTSSDIIYCSSLKHEGWSEDYEPREDSTCET